MSTKPMLPAPEVVHDAEHVDEMGELRERLDELEDALRTLRRDMTQVAGLIRSAHIVFGTASAQGGAPASTSGPLESSRYDPWKQKFPGQTATAIDILVKYEGGLSRKQLAGFLKVEPGSGTMSQIIFKLNKADLIEKDGNIIRLRRI